MIPFTVLGIVTTYQNLPQGYSTIPSSTFDSLFKFPVAMAYDPVGLACAVLSLATNVIATTLIGYKAWYVILLPCHSGCPTTICIRIHRRTIRQFQARGKATQSHALNVMMIIVESGVGYCLLWVPRLHAVFIRNPN